MKKEDEELVSKLITGFIAFTLGGCAVFLLLTMLVTSCKSFKKALFSKITINLTIC